MKIRVTEAFIDKDTMHVKFQSSVGNATASWSGSAPKINEILDVEIDLDDIFSWGKNIRPAIAKTPHITVINGVTLVTAELIQGKDKECAALKLGDSVILIEFDEAPAENSGFVEVSTTKIQLYPTNI
ncbi:hypothetical protein BFW86_16055 [Pseudomonas fluorescens]|nr:hypothetical protein BFW86_16055 [Pseudomonas fluorescens]